MTARRAAWWAIGGLAMALAVRPVIAGQPRPARLSVSASAPVSITVPEPADLLDVTLDAAQPETEVLVVATVQLEYAGTPTHKSVELSISRNGVRLDAPYTVRVGTAARAVSEIPVTLHVWDAPGPGSHRYVLRARSSDPGVRATARRLTAIPFQGD